MVGVFAGADKEQTACAIAALADEKKYNRFGIDNRENRSIIIIQRDGNMPVRAYGFVVFQTVVPLFSEKAEGLPQIVHRFAQVFVNRYHVD